MHQALWLDARLSRAGITVGLMNTHYAYLPIPLVIAAPRTVDPQGKQWNRLRAAIGQPSLVSTKGGGTVKELAYASSASNSGGSSSSDNAPYMVSSLDA